MFVNKNGGAWDVYERKQEFMFGFGGENKRQVATVKT